MVAYADEPLRLVVNRMAETGFTRFPVVERGDTRKLVGMVSLHDLLHARTRALKRSGAANAYCASACRSAAGDSQRNAPGMMTIGHSNRPLAEFVAMLQAHGVELLVDVRTVPRSRHNPQFNRERCRAARGGRNRLPPHAGAGRPAPRAQGFASTPAGATLSFRGYADYMQTPEFAASLDALIAAPGEGRPPSCAPKRCPGAAIAR